jgi:hypothetical protein
VNLTVTTKATMAARTTILTLSLQRECWLGLLPRKWSLALLGQTSANVAQNDSDASVAAEGVLGLLPRKWSLALLGQTSSKVAPQPLQAASRQSVNALFKKLKEVMVRQRMLLRPDERESYDDAWGVDPTGEFVRREDTRLCFNRITEVACSLKQVSFIISHLASWIVGD